MIGWPNEGASERRTVRGIMIRQTLSPKCSRTSCATWSDSFVRASYITSTMVEMSSVGIQVLGDEPDVAHQLAEALERVVLALDRDQDLGGRRHAVDGEQTERRGTVDEDVVVVVTHLGERHLEPQLPAERRHQLDLGTGQVEARRSDEEVLDRRRLDAVLDGHVAQDHVVHRCLQAADVDAEAGAGVALGIEIDDQDPVAEIGQAGTEVDRGGGLADAALLVGDGHDARERRPGPVDVVTHRSRSVGGLVDRLVASGLGLGLLVGDRAGISHPPILPPQRPGVKHRSRVSPIPAVVSRETRGMCDLGSRESVVLDADSGSPPVQGAAQDAWTGIEGFRTWLEYVGVSWAQGAPGPGSRGFGDLT